MLGSKLLKTRAGRSLALAALAGILALQAPGHAMAQGTETVEVGKVIPHLLAVPDQTDQVQGFETLRGTKGLVMLFSRSLAW